MSYEEFKQEMQKLLTAGFKYTPSQVGFEVYAEKMADLSEKYPEFDEMLEAGA